MRIHRIGLIAAAAVFGAACSGKDDAAAAQPGQEANVTKGQRNGDGNGDGNGNGGAGSPRGENGRGGGNSGANGGAAGGGGGSGGGGAAGPGRQQPSITLASSDVTVVKRGSIEEGVSITGDLRPIETVTVRARLEGDLVGVYVREGQHVTQGQLLAKFEDSEQASAFASAKADKLAAESDLTTAQWNLDQTAELFKRGAVAERDFKLAQQTVASSTAKFAAADAKVRATSSVLSDTRAIASTTGVIQTRSVENGEHIARGATLFTLVRTNVLELAAMVPARFANDVKTGQTVNFAADGRSFAGKVARVSPTVDPTTRSVMVYVQIPNENDLLKGGTFATGRVISRTIQKALIIPTAAIRLGGDGQQFVYRLAGKVVDVASVQTGTVDERVGMIEVLDGLTDGDRIIVGNVGTLGRGMQVIIAGEEGGQQGGRQGRPGQQAKQ